MFAGAISSVEGSPGQGDTVSVVDSVGRFLAVGAFSQNSQIRVRVWSFREDEMINEGFFSSRLINAIKLRRIIIDLKVNNSVRLVHGESDGIPGLVVDWYGEVLVVQFLSCGVEKWRNVIVDLLEALTDVSCIFERSDADIRLLEGLPAQIGVLKGTFPTGSVIVRENDLSFKVDIQAGHKTGFYLDQRDNRAIVRNLALDRSVLDCFCYTAGFSINALNGGARSVLGVDASADVLALARSNLALNNLPFDKVDFQQGDVFQVLRKLRDQAARFGMIILDPPKFAPTKSQAEKAARGYKDINLLALKLLEPGGILVTFSCSGGISAELFQKIVSSAALDAGIQGRIVRQLSQAPDHPIGIYFPEGEYLKGLVLVRDQ